jgi:antitoxin ParD1/3/4
MSGFPLNWLSRSWGPLDPLARSRFAPVDSQRPLQQLLQQFLFRWRHHLGELLWPFRRQSLQPRDPPQRFCRGVFANLAMASIGNLCQSCCSELKSTSMGRTSVMPTRNVNLTDELDRFVAKKVETGRYENASEVVRAGLRTLEREEQQYEAKIAGLRAAIDAGDASGIAEGNVFGRVGKALKLPVSPR